MWRCEEGGVKMVEWTWRCGHGHGGVNGGVNRSGSHRALKEMPSGVMPASRRMATHRIVLGVRDRITEMSACWRAREWSSEVRMAADLDAHAQCTRAVHTCSSHAQCTRTVHTHSAHGSVRRRGGGHGWRGELRGLCGRVGAKRARMAWRVRGLCWACW
jgi:hypothetical protein